jgi:hypothetical protein
MSLSVSNRSMSPDRAPLIRGPASHPCPFRGRHPEPLRFDRHAQLRQGSDLDLTDSLACDTKPPADLFQGQPPLVADAEAKPEDISFPGVQRGQGSLQLSREVVA